MTSSPAEDGAEIRPVPFISRVRLQNYKSISSCDVSLSPLTILVGPNGSGKSNFLDALAFLNRAIATTPAEAIDERGGLYEILRRVPEQTESFIAAVEATVLWGPLPNQKVSTKYALEIGQPDLVRLKWSMKAASCVGVARSGAFELGVARPK